MKKHFNYLSLLFTIVLLYGCGGPKYNGHSEKEFEASKKIVGQKLSKDELNNVEKALRVIAAEAIRLKWVETEKYKGRSVNDIALKMIDGRTYSSLVGLAEDLLKQEKDRKTTELSAEIDSLEKKRVADVELKKQMTAMFKVDSLTIEKIDWFGTPTPKLDIDYRYVGQQTLTGRVDVTVELFGPDPSKAIASETWGQGDDASKMKPGESLSGNMVLAEQAKKEPQKWNTLKYPLKDNDLKKLGLHLEIHAIQYTLNGKQVSVPEANDTSLVAQIKRDKADLKDIKNSKGTLDELELTR